MNSIEKLQWAESRSSARNDRRPEYHYDQALQQDDQAVQDDDQALQQDDQAPQSDYHPIIRTRRPGIITPCDIKTTFSPALNILSTVITVMTVASLELAA